MMATRLFEDVKDVWEAYLTHPFVKELGEGTLAKDKFESYLIQDYLYLIDYAKVFAMGVVKAKTINEMNLFSHGIVGMLETETAVHIDYLHDFGYDVQALQFLPKKIENENYVSYMQGIALKGDVLEIVAAVLPCIWSYHYIATFLKENNGEKVEGNFYQPWIEAYSGEDYGNATNKWIEYMNELAKDVTEEEYKQLSAIFRRSSLYELAFWDMAYEDEKKEAGAYV